MTKLSDNLTPSLLLVEQDDTAVVAPAAGQQRLFIDEADGLLYLKDDADAVTAVGGAGGGDVATDTIWDAAGDLAVGSGADTAAKLTIGSTGQVLTVAAGTAAWAAAASSAWDADLTHVVIRDECFFRPIADAYPGALLAVYGGTGAILAAGAASSGHPGILSLSTGTTTTGRCGLGGSAGGEIILGGYALSFAAVVKIPTLSDGTNTYTAAFGLGDGTAPHDATDAVRFVYGSAVNGGKWQLSTMASSSETVADSGVTVDTNWVLLQFTVNAAGNSVEFFIDGSSVGTMVDTIPTTANVTALQPGGIRKSAGTTARTVLIDFYQYVFDPTAARS
ncbi:MAG TPA: hypothetical protein VMW94_03785 [Actinomycetes bacterium]|nr:hypothetical protein [Actinomycetes bacterium]